MSRKPIALQLYSLREDASQDFVGVLECVADLGYQGVEFAGYGGLTARELKSRLDTFGLLPVGAHVGFDALTNDLDQQIAFNQEIGNSRLVCPSPSLESNDRQGWVRFAQKMNTIGEKVSAHGMQLGYHNHSMEFTRYNDEYALNIFFAETNPKLVFAELDLGWVYQGKVDPVTYMQQYANRCPLVHIKDFLSSGDQVEVGTGDVDLAGIVRTSDSVGVEWFIIETEKYTMAPIDSVRVGLENLKRVINSICHSPKSAHEVSHSLQELGRRDRI